MGRLKGGHNYKGSMCSYCGKNLVKSRGLCNACYIRWQRYGNCEYRRSIKTNADRIRNMSDEELARKLYDISWKVALSPERIDSEEDWLDWLKQECKT